MEDLISYLFKTKSINACKENKPFWYTSGKIGTYFISVENLYGSEEEAKELLAYIDEALSDHQTLPKKAFDEMIKQYNSNEIYKYTIDELVKCIKENVNLDEIDYISGGERRDWPFSILAAYFLQKPHLTMYKDLSVKESKFDFSETNSVSSLEGKKILHISDLINTAASYTRAWVPIAKNLGGNMAWTATIIDRVQGGAEILAKEGVKTFSLGKVDRSLFKTALEKEIITDGQFDIINKYLDNPDETMKKFLIEHPEFVKDSLENGTGKTLTRAKKCVEDDVYGLGDLLKFE